MPYCTGVFFAVPAYNKIWTAEVGMSLCQTVTLLQSQGIKSKVQSMGCADIANLRNIFLSHWYYLMRDSSHMCMVDADMHFSPGMIWDMICFSKPLTGVIYSKREEGNEAVGHFIHDHPTTADLDMGFIEVLRVGAGVLMVQRYVIDRMIEKFPDIVSDGQESPVAGVVKKLQLPHFIRAFAPMIKEGGGELSEDLSFCERWLKCGGQVWANAHHPIGHMGHKEYGFCLEQMLQAKEASEAQFGLSTETTGTMLEPYPQNLVTLTQAKPEAA